MARLSTTPLGEVALPSCSSSSSSLLYPWCPLMMSCSAFVHPRSLFTKKKSSGERISPQFTLVTSCCHYLPIQKCAARRVTPHIYIVYACMLQTSFLLKANAYSNFSNTAVFDKSNCRLLVDLPTMNTIYNNKKGCVRRNMQNCC